MNKVVAFRCDSSFQIGTGHIHRCINIAERFENLNYEVIFFCKELAGSAFYLISQKKYKLICFSSDVSMEDEVVAIADYRPNFIVIDSYVIDINWEQELRKKCLDQLKILVIDDLCNRHHDCEYLIDNNFRANYAGLYDNLVPVKCKKFLGPQFSFLPLHYSEYKVEAKQFGTPRKVLVFFGGTDATGEGLKFCNALSQSIVSNTYFLVIAKANRNASGYEKFKSTSGLSFIFSPENWMNFLINSDYYFGSSGTVTWERFFFGLPGGVITTAENQRGMAQQLQMASLQKYYGHYDQIDYVQTLKDLEQKMENTSSLQQQSLKIKSVVKSVSCEQFANMILLES